MQRNHRDLKVWQEAMTMVEHAYRATETFPRSETFGLASQVRRAAVSVPANIAEGFARRSTKEPLQFLGVAAGSLSELDTLIELSGRLGLVNCEKDLQGKVDRVSGLLMGLMASLQRKRV